MDSTDFFLLFFGIAGRSANLPCITNSKILRELTVCDKFYYLLLQGRFSRNDLLDSPKTCHKSVQPEGVL